LLSILQNENRLLHHTTKHQAPRASPTFQA
jgi:hypothetical protein